MMRRAEASAVVGSIIGALALGHSRGLGELFEALAAFTASALAVVAASALVAVLLAANLLLPSRRPL